MPNFIKSATTVSTGTIKKNNFLIAVNTSLEYGPTSSTNFWSGITPPSGGYTVYQQKASQGPSIRTATNDSELITIAKQYGGTNINTVYDALVFFNSNSSYMVTNIDYENIVTNGLLFDLDAGFIPGYPRTGTTWYDVSGNSYDGTLVNGPTFDSNNNGSLVFDGVNKYVNGAGISSQLTGDITVEVWIKTTVTPTDWVRLIGTGNNPSGNRTFGLWLSVTRAILWQRYGGQGGSQVNIQTNQTLTTNTWYQIAATTSGSSQTVYINGSSVLTGTGAGPWTASNENITLASSVSIHTFLTGNMSIGRIYNRALSSSEILQNYNSQKGRYGL
jgi:hypothetical protein